jgi:HD-GYP domain-containing protein (c-di-GMP phosphodiesterase class II)
VKLTKKLDVDQLEIGMYVVQLDRPWLETPFLFQGFYIRDDDELTELKKHCSKVYVSQHSLPQTPTAVTPATVQQPNNGEDAAPKNRGFSLRSLFRRDTSQRDDDFEQTNVIYTETTTLKEEFQAASGVKEQAVATLKGVMQNLRNSGELEIGALESAVTPMVDSVLRNSAALACLMRMQEKSDYLYQHSLASTVWAAILGRQIGLARSDIDLVALGAMLLDVGKTQIPMEILTKPGRLDDKERAIMRRHVQFGLDILDKAGDVDSRVYDMLAHHHERYNGTGYPNGVSGSAIPVFGRIAGIVDAYDAMITPRPYAKLLSSYDALRRLRLLSDVEFQAEIVDQFTRAIGAFPTGTLVELNTGEVGIVTRQNRIRRLRPEVMIIMDADKQTREEFRVVDLNEEKTTDSGDQSLWIERGLPPGIHGIDPTKYYID